MLLGLTRRAFPTAQKYAGVKLLGGGSERLSSPLRLEVQDATQRAIAAIEGAGG